MKEMLVNETTWMPAPTKDYAAAKRQYVELYGSLAVMNTYLKIAVLALSSVALALVALHFRTLAHYRHLEPIVIRINEVGRAEAINYGSLEYHPQEAEIKYFLAQFVRGHYGRMRATVQESYTRSLYFLDGRLAEAAMEANKKTQAIEAFLTGHTEEIDILVKNVAIEDLRQSPYKASVQFEKIYYALADHRETRRDRYVASFVFLIKMPVANALIPVNPLGLTITYFREDQAFD
jgi:type IV secretion system protein VirB5